MSNMMFLTIEAVGFELTAFCHIEVLGFYSSAMLDN